MTLIMQGGKGLLVVIFLFSYVLLINLLQKY